MRIRHMRLSIIFKLALVTAAFIAISIQMGVWEGELRFSSLNYYTLMTNVLCAVYFLIALVHEVNGGGTWRPSLKGAVVMGITVTWLVYHFVLSGHFKMQGAMALSNILLHYVVPIMAVTDWLVFSEKGQYTWKYPFIWLLLPDGYFAYVAIRVALGGSLGPNGNRYPYPFINVDLLGWKQVIINGAFLNLFFLALGFVFVIIDRFMAKKPTNRSKSKAANLY